MRATRHIDSSPRGARAVALVAAAGITVHLVLRFSAANLRHWADVPLYVALVAGELPLVVQLLKKLWAWEFGSDFLAGGAWRRTAGQGRATGGGRTRRCRCGSLSGVRVGTELVRRLLQIARTEKIRCVDAHILSENAAMLALAKYFHFDCVPDEDQSSLTATLHLDEPRART